ncbi:ferredoxin--NADP reductase [Mesorhizobium sp. 1B3]|uniref:ferredoxin--NADP reductase n=1 Tax=Mesorhizobium sp. 1B3 TaxID=3243599 RepID=UPI003D98A64C
MSNFHQETVLAVRHWTDTLFSFRTTRDPGFRFSSGQFTMMGLEIAGKPLTRAYSIASGNYDEILEFFSIKVPDGPLTSRLQNLREGDRVLVGKKAVGTLLHDNLLPGKRLWLLSTGTGLAPFLSVIKDMEIYQRFERVILAHGVRHIAELAYTDFITKDLPGDTYLGPVIGDKLVYYPTVTREPYRNRGRLTDLIWSGKLFKDLSLPDFDIAADRIMICGGPDMLAEIRAMLDARGFVEGSHGTPAHFVIEKAFVDK